MIGYLFYRSYSSISIKENNQEIQKNSLQNSINLNSSKIAKIENLLSENNQKLNNIFNVLDKKNESNYSDNILKEIQDDLMNVKSGLKNNFERWNKGGVQASAPLVKNSTPTFKKKAPKISSANENAQDLFKDLFGDTK